MGSERAITGQGMAENATLSNPEKWVDAHGNYLFRFALLRVRDPQLAEDMVQETLLAALQSREYFSGHSSEKSWLVGILKHKIFDHFRKISRESPVENVEWPGNEMEEVFDKNGHWKMDETSPAEWAADPSTLVEQKEFWAITGQCLSKLPSRMASAFSLREIDGLSSEKICEILNISISNLWVMLHRARMQLRHCLEIHWFGRKGG